MDMDTTKKISFSLLLLVLVLCNNSFAEDTISAGQSLTKYDRITSENGVFSMGFFSPTGDFLFQNYYLGISYNNDRASVVWVANRDKPLSDPLYSELKLLENGTLVLYGWSKSVFWSIDSAPTTSKNTTEVILRNDGNLVLRKKDNPSVVYWQSFDHPTDTWLPGQNLVINKKTNVTLLTSWRNRNDPTTGIFSLATDSTGVGPLLIKWNKSVPYWTSSANTFHSYSFSYNSNENESYFTYNLMNSSNPEISNGDNSLSRLVMDVSGQLQRFEWSDRLEKWIVERSEPEQLCDVYGICGAFGNCNQDTSKCECLPGFVERSSSNLDLLDSTDRCLRNTPLQCGSKYIFKQISTSKLPDNPRSDQQVNTAEECKSACQSKCSCNAYAYGNTGCQLWEGDMLNTKNQSDGRYVDYGNFYLRLANRSQVRKRRVVFWKILIPVLIVSLLATIMGIYLCKRNKANERGRLKGLQGVLTDLSKNKATYNDTMNTNMLNDCKTKGETQELQIFNLDCLAIATNNFCLQNKLGQGGFGPVYKGELQNGQQIAVKRLSKSSGQGVEEFKNEVVLISKLQHRNLVKLLGCCVQGQENMLIYEYMPNKSLDAFLFDPRKKTCLDWDKRFNIIGGIARGLLYLHRDSRLRVIHRDLKVSNVLLDEDMIPKISDFGMARIFDGNQAIDNTNRVVGTIGYMSPEYMIGGTFSEKSDVFSFGVLVLEVVSGKRNNSFYNPEQPLNLLLHAWRLWNEGKWSEIVDEALGDLYSPNEVIKCLHIGLLCGQNRAADRPTMAEVDLMLNYETDRPSPKEPPYSFPASSSDKPGIPPIHCSNNNVTWTMIDGR